MMDNELLENIIPETIKTGALAVPVGVLGATNYLWWQYVVSGWQLFILIIGTVTAVYYLLITMKIYNTHRYVERERNRKERDKDEKLDK